MKYRIPELPLSKDVETKKVLKQTIASNKKLGELKGIEVTATETIKLINDIRNMMSKYKFLIREKFPKIYTHELLNNIFKYPYTKIDFVMNDVNVTRLTATSRLNKLIEMKLLTKVKYGRENYYVNDALYTLLINEFHMNTKKVDVINSNG